MGKERGKEGRKGEEEGEIASERKTERDILHLLDHSPCDCNGRNWAGPRSGARSLFGVSYLGAGSQGFGYLLQLSQAISGELERKWSSKDMTRSPSGIPALARMNQQTRFSRFPKLKILGLGAFALVGQLSWVHDSHRHKVWCSDKLLKWGVMYMATVTCGTMSQDFHRIHFY